MGLAVGLLIIILGLLAYVRFAPSDPAIWQVAVATTDPATPGPCVAKIALVAKGARATCLLAGTPLDTFAKLDATAMATPRTSRLAGLPTDARITWVSRSRLMGFPDYITAEVSQSPAGTRLDIFSRQRFGNGDGGVNAARLHDWLAPF